MRTDVIVVGFGSHHGDDIAGWEVVSQLADVETRAWSDPSGLANIPASCRRLMVVDACRGSGPTGTISRFVWPDLPTGVCCISSTHDLGLAAGLQLAESLRRLPKQVVIFTVEAGPFEPGSALSREVAEAVPHLVEVIRKEIMNAAPTPDDLLATPLLAPLTDAEAAKLAAAAVRESFHAGTVIFRAGDFLQRFWIVESGRVAIEIPGPDRRPRRLHTIEPGELLGWSPLLGPAPMTATARTLEPTTLLSFDAGAVLTLCESDPAFGYRFMSHLARAIAGRLNSTRLQLLDAFHVELPAIAEGVLP